MDALIRTGVDLDNTKDVLVSYLQLLLSEQNLTNLRVQLFDEAKCAGLVHPSDNIVRRQKRAVGPTLVTKYATDIAKICYAIKHQQPVSPLLKNGKRSAATFIASRQHQASNNSNTSAVNITVSPQPSNQTQQPTGCCAPHLNSISATATPIVEPTGLSNNVRLTQSNVNMANTSHLMEYGRPIAALMRDISFL